MTDNQADIAAKQRAEAEKKRAAEVRKKLADERQARQERMDASTKAAAAIKPTPTQTENDQFALAVASNTLPQPPWYHAADGSPIDPQSPDPTPPGTPTWP